MESSSSNHSPETPTEGAAASSGSPRFPLPRWAKGGLIAVLIALASVGYLQSSFWHKADSSKAGSADLDQDEATARKSAGEFDVVDADGNKHPFASYKGNVVILSFWASWCAQCLVELPEFAKLADEFGSRGLKVIPINVDEADKGLTFTREFWKKKDFDFPSFFDAKKDLAARFGVDMLPANFVIDRHGRIAFSGFGANDWTAGEVVDIIEDLLDEDPD